MRLCPVQYRQEHDVFRPTEERAKREPAHSFPRRSALRVFQLATKRALGGPGRTLGRRTEHVVFQMPRLPGRLDADCAGAGARAAAFDAAAFGTAVGGLGAAAHGSVQPIDARRRPTHDAGRSSRT
jgi:hypothetical protein